MTTELHPEILRPSHPYVLRLAAMGLGCGLIGASIMIAAVPERVVQAPPITLTEIIAVPMMIPMIVTAETMPMASASATSVSIVFAAGGATYMKLADAEKDQRHGGLKMHDNDGVVSAIGAVADADVPADLGAWKGREVIVDGTCHASVTGFAIVARVTGDPFYTDAVDVSGWTTKQILKDGSPVLAARLDGCRGGELARDAGLPNMVIPKPIDDPELVETATKLLFASGDATTVRRDWAAWETEGKMTLGEPQFGEHETLVVRHPTTGITYVSVHATTGGGCGTPTLSLWGLYRVEPDRSLTRMPSSEGELLSIEKLVDVDGDGQLEVIGRPWLGVERMVNRLTGETIEQLALPFYGCPC